jgi:effector-binding domain-containing protein
MAETRHKKDDTAVPAGAGLIRRPGRIGVHHVDPTTCAGQCPVPVAAASRLGRDAIEPVRHDGRMDYEVVVKDVPARQTAVVSATTTWQEFPALWGQLLGQVWDCLRAAGIYRGCRNIMLYLDDVPNVEVGVLLDRPCPLTGRVALSVLPAGTTAMTVHRGPFEDVGLAHGAVRDWCASNGSQPTGTRWEVYGPNDDDPARQWTEVYWQLA